MEGQLVGGRYAVVRELGRGGMGAVYEARHTGTGRRVAVKVITADLARSPALLQRFDVEARAGGGIDSQYIAQVLDTGTDETGSPYIVMEYLVGEDLFQLVSRITPLPVNLALRVVAQACLGLEKAHQAKIIHRDIKPANIFLCDREGDEIGVKILDFGVAKIRLEDGQSANALTRTGSLLGSPLYMSPEQARGDKTIDNRSDVWSLGVVLYETLCGVTPFHEIEALGSLIIAICGERPPTIQQRAPWVPPEVATILHKALAQRPGDRFQSAYEMFRAIKAVLPSGAMTIDKSMVVPLSMEERAHIAPPMSSTVPVLSNSAPGTFEEHPAAHDGQPRVVVMPKSIRPPPAPQGPESEVDSTMRSEPGKIITADGTLASPSYARPGRASKSSLPPPAAPRPGSSASSALAPASSGGGASPVEQARTTGGITSESGKTLSAAPAPSPKSFVPYAVGAIVLAGLAAFAGVRFGRSGGAAPAIVPAPPAVTVAETSRPAPQARATALQPAPTVSPAVTAPPAESGTAAAATGTSSTKPSDAGPPLGRGKLAPKATAAPATTSVGGRIIQTDLPP